MKTKLLNQLCLFVVFGMTSAFMFAQTTFSYTGNMQTYTVPVGMNTLTIEAHGAQGQNNANANGGLGGHISGKITVTPGDVLNIYVGGQDGYNGGGAGGAGSSTANQNGVNGGGASDVRFGGTDLSDRIIVAGGGGGGGRGNASCNNHGGGGGYPGGFGGESSGEVANTGATGTATAGGDAGLGSCSGTCACSPGGGGGAGGDGGGAAGGYGIFGGILAVGGTGGACGGDEDGSISGANPVGTGGCFGIGGIGGSSGNGGGAGGGGGWYGGGAGGSNFASGGGGGSSYVAPSVTDLMFTNATRVGDGEITITPSLTLGVDDYDSTKISLFPNPTSGVVTINTTIQNAKVFSITGKKVFETNTNTFDISKLNAGVYLLEVITDKGDKIVKRLIKK